MKKHMCFLFFTAVLVVSSISGCGTVPVSSAPTQTSDSDALKFPASILEFEAHEYNKGEISLADTTSVQVQINNCMYGEPVQYITDSDAVASARDAVSKINVTGLADTLNSTKGGESFLFYDSYGKLIFDFSFQDGMLLGKSGRYSIEGQKALYSLDGIKYSDDWKAYYEAEDEKKSEYEDGYRLSFPSTVFEVSGYDTNHIYKDIGLEGISSVTVSISSGDIKSFNTTDINEIKAIYTALCDMQVTGESGDNTTGQKWFVTISYKVPGENFYDSAYLSFRGSSLVSDFAQDDDTYYDISNLDPLFHSADSEMFRYLKENRMTEPGVK